jgi:Prp8 binding protein
MASLAEEPLSKRMRGDEEGAMVVAQRHEKQQKLTRSSSLPSPTLKLTGHTGSVYSLQYSPKSGAVLCSTSFDMTCLLWRHGPSDGDDSNDHYYPNGYDEGELQQTKATYENFCVLRGHKNAVLDCAWCDQDCIATCSADKTVMLWDATTGNRLRKWAEHTGIVNSVTNVSEHQVASASDDCTVLLWDRRQKRPTSCYTTEYPILAVAAAEDSSESAHSLFTSGIDPKIYCWDTRRTATPVYGMTGHTDTVTSLAVHPETTHILSNSMDQTIRSWDIRPFGGTKRHAKTFVGHRHSVEKGLLKCDWSADGSMVTGGSSDGRVHIWDEVSTQELYDLPGHAGCVHAVTFHPVEVTVVASGSSDKQIYVGELS